MIPRECNVSRLTRIHHTHPAWRVHQRTSRCWVAQLQVSATTGEIIEAESLRALEDRLDEVAESEQPCLPVLPLAG